MVKKVDDAELQQKDQNRKRQGSIQIFSLKILQRTNHLEKGCLFKGHRPIQYKYPKKMGYLEKNSTLKQKKEEETSQQAN